MELVAIRPRPYMTVYSFGKSKTFGHSCTLRGAARASFAKIIYNKKLIVQIYDMNETLLVAMLWQRNKGIWCAAHKDIDNHFLE